MRILSSRIWILRCSWEVTDGVKPDTAIKNGFRFLSSFWCFSRETLVVVVVYLDAANALQCAPCLISFKRALCLCIYKLTLPLILVQSSQTIHYRSRVVEEKNYLLFSHFIKKKLQSTAHEKKRTVWSSAFYPGPPWCSGHAHNSAGWCKDSLPRKKVKKETF